MRPSSTARRSLLVFALPLLTAILASCHSGEEWPPSKAVGLTAEVRDGTSGGLLSGAKITLVEVEHEWSACVCKSPFDVFGITDQTGQVRFEPEDFAAAEVGFLEDGHGRAVLQGHPNKDEAIVVLVVTRTGYRDELVKILLSNAQPDRLAIVMLPRT